MYTRSYAGNKFSTRVYIAMLINQQEVGLSVIGEQKVAQRTSDTVLITRRFFFATLIAGAEFQ